MTGRSNLETFVQIDTFSDISIFVLNNHTVGQITKTILKTKFNLNYQNSQTARLCYTKKIENNPDLQEGERER